MEVWTELKTKLRTTITELKAQHKDKWAVVKFKSASKPADFLFHHGLESLKNDLQEKQSLLQKMDQRSRNQLLSPADNYDQLVKEVKDLQKEITWQELIAQNPLLQKLWKEKLSWFQFLLQTQQNQTSYHQQLAKINKDYRQLTNQLNWLRTLVRAGDIQQLQDLVRQAKI